MQDNIPEYASCLLVDYDEERILLIKKNRPDWQAGKLNIIGGHVEGDKDTSDAAIREVFEEVGIELKNIRYFCLLNTVTPCEAVVYFYVAFCDIETAIQKTDEEPVSMLIEHAIDMDIIPNLKYLIPLALDNNMPIAIISEETSTS